MTNCERTKEAAGWGHHFDERIPVFVQLTTAGHTDTSQYDQS